MKPTPIVTPSKESNDVMKKLLLSLIAVASLVSFTSCEKKLTSLAGSRWEDKDGLVEITFTDTHATVTQTSSRGVEVLTGTYTFDPPAVTITSDPTEQTPAFTHTGTVKKKTMEIGIHETLDLVGIFILRKQ